MKKIELAIPSERLLGFTIPAAGRFYVCDHDEVWEIGIGPPLRVELTDHTPYRFVPARNDFLGAWDIGTAAILSHGDTQIAYDFDPYADRVTVMYRAGGGEGRIDFPTFSGDWFFASLSVEGDHLVLAEPYRIELYEVA